MGKKLENDEELPARLTRKNHWLRKGKLSKKERRRIRERTKM